jgi:hypothetical protein
MFTQRYVSELVEEKAVSDIVDLVYNVGEVTSTALGMS